MKDKGPIILRNVGHGVNDIYWFVLPSLLPLILEQFDIRYGTAGGLLTGFIGVIAVFSFILGKLSDRVSRLRLLGFGFLIASVFLVCAALMDSLSLFVVFLLLAGVGVSSYHPTAYALIDETTRKRHGAEYGMFEFWGSAAIFLMFFLHGLLLQKLHWQTIFLITAAPGLAVGPLLLRQAAKHPARHAGPVKSAHGAAAAPNTPAALFIFFLIAVALRFFGIIAVVNFTPIYLVREVGLGASFASFATGIYFLGGLIFTPLTGRLCDRRGPFPVLLFATSAAFPLIFLIGVPGPLWVLPLYLLLLGGAYYGAGPAMNMIIAQMSSRIGKGEAFGYFMAIIAVTYSFSPLLFGLNADRVGLRLSMRLFSFPLLLSSAALLALFLLVRGSSAEHAPG